MHNPEKIVGIFFFGLGLLIILMVLCVVLYRKSFRRSNNVVKTTAVVVENYRRYSTQRVYYSVIEFAKEDGEVIRCESKFGTNPPRFKEGEKVTLYYRRDKPQKYQLYGSKPLKFASVFLIVFGMIFCIAGVINFLGYMDTLEKMLN